MKALFMSLFLLIINVPAYALTTREIKSVCAEIAAEQAKTDESVDLHVQKLIENACICVGLEIPSSISKQKFKQLIMTEDESITDIYKVCAMQELFSMPEMQLLMLSDF